MKSGNISWLLNELPGLVREGVITQAAADRLRNHYAAIPRGTRTNLALALLTVLGSLLIGSGIIILLAHNWDTLSHGSRAALALVPLVLAQGLGAYVLLKRRDSWKWTESAAALILLLCGSSLAIVGQTYHLGGTAYQFFLAWMALSLPLVYLFDSTLAALLVMAGLGAYLNASVRQYPALDHRPLYLLFFWLLLAGMVPFYALKLRKGRHAVPAVLLSVAFMAVLFVALFAYTDYHMLDVNGHEEVFLAVLLFTFFYLAGKFIEGDAPSLWQQPLQSAGIAVLVGVAFFHAYDRFWHSAILGETVFIVALGSLVAAAAAGFILFRLRRDVPSPAVAVPVLYALGTELNHVYDGYLPSLILFNIFIFLAGLFTFLKGVRMLSMTRINGGMLLVAALITGHFFATEISFLAKGMVFVVTGVVFVATNLVLFRKKRSA